MFLTVCPNPCCQEPRYDQCKLAKSNGKDKVPQKVFTTFALGPQLQAEWKNPQTAERMLYWWRVRDMVFFELFLVIFHDFLCCFTPPTFFSLSFTLRNKDKTRAIIPMT